MEKLLKIDTCIDRFEYAVVSLSDENLAFIASASTFFTKNPLIQSVDLLQDSFVCELIDNDEINQDEYDMIDELQSYGDESSYTLDDLQELSSVEPAKYLLTLNRDGRLYVRGYLNSEATTECYFVTDEIEILNSK